MLHIKGNNIIKQNEEILLNKMKRKSYKREYPWKVEVMVNKGSFHRERGQLGFFIAKKLANTIQEL